MHTVLVLAIMTSFREKRSLYLNLYVSHKSKDGFLHFSKITLSIVIGDPCSSIIELVDSISRDGPDTPIYIIHYKKRNNSE